jgi:hypothetical protein
MEGGKELKSGGTERWCVPFSKHLPLFGGVEEGREQHVDCKAVMRISKASTNYFFSGCSWENS